MIATPREEPEPSFQGPPRGPQCCERYEPQRGSLREQAQGDPGEKEGGAEVDACTGPRKNTENHQNVGLARG